MTRTAAESRNAHSRGLLNGNDDGTQPQTIGVALSWSPSGEIVPRYPELSSGPVLWGEPFETHPFPGRKQLEVGLAGELPSRLRALDSRGSVGSRLDELEAR